MVDNSATDDGTISNMITTMKMSRYECSMSSVVLPTFRVFRYSIHKIGSRMSHTIVQAVEVSPLGSDLRATPGNEYSNGTDIVANPNAAHPMNFRTRPWTFSIMSGRLTKKPSTSIVGMAETFRSPMSANSNTNATATIDSPIKICFISVLLFISIIVAY